MPIYPRSFEPTYTKKLTYTDQEIHCEMCGRKGHDLGIWDGYTCCCNELTCDGDGFHEYENEDGETFCCSGLAERMGKL